MITGASSGIGLATAKSIASLGWHVIGLGRDPARCADAEAMIRYVAAANVCADMVCADLSLMAEAARAASDIKGLTDRIDLLVNNAGGTSNARSTTAEGNERTFAANHLGPFLLTNSLLPLLRVAAADGPPGSVRIINVSSSAHEFVAGMDWDDLQSIARFEPTMAYCRAKLANVLFTVEMSKRLSQSGIVTHAMHPGSVATRFFTYGDEDMQEYGRTHRLISPEEVAQDLIWLALDEEPGKSTGRYWHARTETPTGSSACDEQNARRLWCESEKLVDLWLD